MPLPSLWSANPEAVTELTIEHIVSTAGDGKLRDDSECARELRQYLSQVSTERLSDYVSHCLAIPYPKSGLVLQGIVNELGRRLRGRAREPASARAISKHLPELESRPSA